MQNTAYRLSQYRQVVNAIVRVSIKIMGVCCGGNTINQVECIPDPTGQPIDPLQSKGDILDIITADPHIHFFKKQIQNAIMPSSRAGRRIKSKQEIPFATTDKKQYQSYLQYINNSLQGNQLSTTNVLSYLFKEVADARQVQHVQSKFKNQKYAALKCFVYMYTGDYAYKKVNKQLRTNEYSRLAPVIALIKKELKLFSKESSSLHDYKITTLYRAIDTPDPLMIQKARIYWKGFTSTALNKQVIKRFGRYQYTIYLKRDLVQQYLIIPKQISHYEEEQVLIFPYFYFQVQKVQSFKANKLQNYEILQLPPEGDDRQDIEITATSAHEKQA